MPSEQTPLELLLHHFERKVSRAEPITGDELAIASALAISRPHPGLHALLAFVVERRIVFGPIDFIMEPEVLLRGKEGERWNAGERVVTRDDVCVARNGGGDYWVFNATTGVTRRLIHDEGWRARGSYDTVDSFILNAMLAVLENIDFDDLPEGDEYLMEDLRVAVAIAGEYMDDDWLEKAFNVGLRPGE